MTPGHLGFVLGVAALGCATQQATSQAMTIAGAAAVVVGASMAANNRCHDVSPEGGAAGFCSSGLSRGTRNVGTGVAVAGAALAAAGYALQPKGPDRLQGGGNALPAPAAPYRLVRAAPLPEVAAPLPARSEPSEEDCGAPAEKPTPEHAPEGAPKDDASVEDAANAPAKVKDPAPCAGKGDATPPAAAEPTAPGTESEPSAEPER